MHSAPSVSYPVGRSAFALRLAAALALLGLGAVAAWTWQAATPGWRQAVGLAAVILAGAAAWRAWLASPRGVLRWTGGEWAWDEGGQVVTGAVALALDLQSHLLLRWDGAGAARWFWLERSAAPADWDALRRAVYSRASLAAPQQGTPPAAER